MINLTCTHCRAALEMDDGFAGGACRCQYCGTIQTVPSHLKHKHLKPKQSRTLYQNQQQAASGAAGLNQLADVVASSGLGSGLTSRRLHKKPSDSATEVAINPNRIRMILFGAGALIAILLALVIYLSMRSSPGTVHAVAADAPAVPGAVHAGSVVAVAKPQPNFCGLPLTGGCVIYVLDRGDSTREHFGDLKSVTFKSIRSLGTDRKFQIIFWNNGADAAYPSDWPTYATADHIAAAQHAIDDIPAHGKTDITSALTKALAAHPSQIVIATGKAWDLDASFVSLVQRLDHEAAVPIHAIALGDAGAGTALQTVAAQSNGEYKALSGADLHDLAQ
jgi:VWA domain-containing protein